jgi:hypothetical protein
MYHWKYYDNGWHITEKATLTWIKKTAHWKGYDNRWHITKKATLMWIEKITHWKGYDNGWPIIEKATLTRTEKTTLMYRWKGYDDVSHYPTKHSTCQCYLHTLNILITTKYITYYLVLPIKESDNGKTMCNPTLKADSPTQHGSHICTQVGCEYDE